MAEYVGASVEDMLTALAVAYQIQCRLIERLDNLAWIDYPSISAIAVAAAGARLLELSADQATSAVAIAGTSLNGLTATRKGQISNWKALASGHASSGAVAAVFLAKSGITGPEEFFEGPGGLCDTFRTGSLDVDWRAEKIDMISKVVLKSYCAQIHSQAPIEAVLDLKSMYSFSASTIVGITADVHQRAYAAGAGREFGDKKLVHTKEAADHSLPYMLAVAALDGAVGPPQFALDRIRAADVQELLERVDVSEAPDLTAVFPEEQACRVSITLKDGSKIATSKRDFRGFTSNPLSIHDVRGKILQLISEPYGQDAAELLDEIIQPLFNARLYGARDLARALRE
jgi:2-methylcitrate dehydratase